MMAETIVAKRSLGEGHWDRKLMERMVELSVADNYEDAKEEWIATGSVWWGGNDDAPEWVTNSQQGVGKCLCGHNVVYHFEIRNLENGTIECVGSDHINTYLIMKEISIRTGRDISDISDGEIDTWIQERTKSMIAEAWMHKNGKMFNDIYERIKEIDVLFNVKSPCFMYYDHTDKRYRYGSHLRKKSKYQPTDVYYQMASIVWRWEHPENSKAQSRTRGYPTDKLWQDMIIFDAKCLLEYKEKYDRMMLKAREKTVEYNERMERQRIAREERLERERIERERREAEEAERLRIYNLPENVEKRRIAAEEAERKRIERQEELRRQREIREARQFEIAKQNLANNNDSPEFRQMCLYYGIEPFGVEIANSRWEANFLNNIKNQMRTKKPLSDRQLETLREIVLKTATEAQMKYLADLGYEGPKISRKKASEKIKELKERNENV